MMASVDVIYHREPDGAWWADSPQVPGFVAGGDSLAEVRELVREGIPFYLNDDEVDIREAREGGLRLDLTTGIDMPIWGSKSWGIGPRSFRSDPPSTAPANLLDLAL